ncbi:glycosyltransferase [Chelatococcus sambhunathii]|uniref:Glycosyltransferase n=1 Tax=Chelatococcus sambhunathii TaxID=363953 RepID=A0ABU1DCX9_9HYPH|nr:glycosyltransferase [Chelatococcus sambhunathii]MDR4305963.1 glycosyltransferase [Chelatococcus sambhunathii]
MTAKTGLSPFEVVQTATISVDGRTVAVPLYAPDGAVTSGRFDRVESGVRFALEAGATMRLVQFANKPSSKQRQSSYLLRLPAGGDLKIEVATGGGRYGEGCFLCLQIYGLEHGFITQVWMELSGRNRSFEVKLPKRAAFGCLATQISGAGTIGDIEAVISGSSGAGQTTLGFEPGVRRPEELAELIGGGGASEARAAEELRRVAAAQPDVVIAAAGKWYWERSYHALTRMAALSATWPDVEGLGRVVVNLKYFVARALGNLNATVSAQKALAEIQEIKDWRRLLGAREAQAVLILHGQALMRNGRIEDGLAALNVARLNDPTHWEAYYLLANNLDEQDGPLKDAYYQAAATLLARPHPKLTVATVENDLRNGRWADALSKALAGVAASTEPVDVWLALANVYLHAGDLESWQHYLRAYFKQFGLFPPRFDLRSAPPEARYASLGTAAPAAEAATRGTVAVIMTTYNSQDVLALAARSVLAQTYPGLKLVIVDDDSSDGTLEIARALAAEDPRVEILPQTTNCGTYACKNVALASVEADYYTFHDSDDWMHPQRIARHLDVMEETGAVCTTSLWFRMEAHGRAAARHAGGYQHTNPASIFIRKEVLSAVGYFDCVRTGADTEFFWRVRNRFERDKVQDIPLPLAIGLFHDASLTQSGVTAFNRHRFSEVRLAYWESWVGWHLETLADDPSRLRVPFPLRERPYWAPPAITPEGGRPALPEAAVAIIAAEDQARERVAATDDVSGST